MNSLIITNKLPAYKEIRCEGYWNNKKFNHIKKEYARIETILMMQKLIFQLMGLKIFEVFLKRGVKVTYIRSSKKWMQSYVDEFTFRQNHKDKVLFKEILERI